MKYSLKKKNQYILLILMTFVTIHSIIGFLGVKDTITPLPDFFIIFCLLIIVLFSLKKADRLVCILLTIGLNGYGLLFNLETHDLTHRLIIFILLLFFLALYQSFWLNLSIMVVTMVEFYILLKFHYGNFSHYYNQSDITIFFLVITFFSIVAIVQKLYFQNKLKRLEEEANTKEKELFSKEGYLKLFFKYAKDSIAVFDLDNRVIEVNPAFEELYGWAREECIGKKICMVPFEDLYKANERIKRMYDGESFHLLETKDMKKDGTIFDAEITLSPIFDSKGKIIATSVITRDISYKKEAEQIRIHSEKLKVAGEIAAGVAHEIRNPLTVISGFVQMMNEDQNSPYTYYTNLIDSEIDRINLIISEFLVLSKPSSIRAVDFNIDLVLSDIVTLYKPELQTKNITLSVQRITEGLIVSGNPNQIKQVFINLIKNASEAIQRDGEITVTIDKTNDHFCSISIKDTGQGMKKEVVEHIFEPFYTTKPDGTGLGMMIIEKIIKEHHGHIDIDSSFGKGTEIKFYLPLHKEN
ncbi:nitrogen regulation protein NR(II) [uncultured Rummeliibacillus sp.]|uniref:two-component system sensor histidine kinase NtrB n=1 Tax=uncultured Rummeliibacillus sp. TaxID=762292 RepID=UPI002631C4B0|nr:ATP-binding protein [uncultured Rummeliibacillus sp.]